MQVEVPKPVLTPKQQVLAAIEKTGGNVEETKKEVSKVIEQIKVEQPEALQEIAAHSEQAKEIKRVEEEKIAPIVNSNPPISSENISEIANINGNPVTSSLITPQDLYAVKETRKIAATFKADSRAQFLRGFRTHQISFLQLQRNELVLAEKLNRFFAENNDYRPTSVLVKEGDTLQSISYNLYYTTRRWPELYLLNREILDSWDQVEPTMKLRAYVRVKSKGKSSRLMDRLSDSGK